MCLCGAEVQPEAWGFQWRLHEGSGLHAHCTASVNAASAEQEMNYCSGQSGKYLTPLPSPSPNNPFSLPAWSANQVAKAPLVFPFFFFKEEKSGRVPHIKELCYSTNELPLLSPLSPHLQNSVEHYWSGVLVCRLGHMTEDIFFCYNAKEAPEKDKQKRSIKLKGERKQELNL